MLPEGSATRVPPTRSAAASRAASSGSRIVKCCSVARPRRRLPGAATLPGVPAEVVVVAARAQERRLGAELRHQVEPEQVAVEADRLVDVGDAQVDVTHPRTVRQPAERRLVVRLQLQEVVEVERPAAHPLDLALPELTRPVPVDLDPVVVGVAQVEGLADEVVGRPRQGHALPCGVRQPAREVDPLRNEQREVEEARVAVSGPRSRQLGQVQQRLAAGAERGLAVGVLEHVQADRPAVVVE